MYGRGFTSLKTMTDQENNRLGIISLKHFKKAAGLVIKAAQRKSCNLSKNIYKIYSTKNYHAKKNMNLLIIIV